MKTTQAALAQARKTWPAAKLRTARSTHRCDNSLCGRTIYPEERYIDPGDSNPDRAGGMGGFRYCVVCAGGNPTHPAPAEHAVKLPGETLTDRQDADLADDETWCVECERIFDAGDSRLHICAYQDDDKNPCNSLVCDDCTTAHEAKHPPSIIEELCAALAEVVKAEDVKMGRRAVKLRIEIARNALARAERGGSR